MDAPCRGSGRGHRRGSGSLGHSGDDIVMLRLFLKMKPQDLLKADRNSIMISTKIVQIDVATEWLERISSAP